MASEAAGPRERFFEAAPALLAILRPDGRIEDVNPAWALRLAPADRLEELVHPASRESAEAVWRRAVAGAGDAWSVDRFRGAGGGELWLSWWASEVEGGARLHVAAREVGAEKEIAENPLATKLSESEDERERLVQLVNNSSDFIGMATPAGEVFFVNSSGRRMVGLPLAGDVPVPIFDYLTEQTRRRLLEEVLPAVAAEGRWVGSAAFRDFSDPGREVEVDVALFAVRDPRTGTTSALATIARDNADRRRAERAGAELEASRHRQRQAVQLNDDVVQGLIAAKLALELGRPERAAASVAATLEAARAIVSDLLAASAPEGGYAPGDLLRTRPVREP